MIRLLVILVWLIPSLCFGATTVPLPITEVESVARTGHPVTIGFPLPANSGVTSKDNIKLIRNSDSAEIDCQKEVTARWSSGGNIKWVLLDFQATVSADAAETPATATYSVVYGTDVTAGTPTDEAVVTTETGYYLVDVGDLSFKVSRTDSLKIYDVLLGAQTLVNSESPWVAKMTIGGVEYNTDNASVYSVAVETDGTERVTIKCTGEFESASAVSKFRHETRITAYAGNNDIKVQHSIIFDEDMMDLGNEPAAIYMSTPLQIGSTINVAIGGDSTDGIITPGTTLGATDSYYLHQQYYNTVSDGVGTDYGYLYGGSVGSSGNGTRSAGWMDVNDGSYGVTVHMRDMWQKYPAKIMVDSKELRVMQWPGHDYTDVVNHQKSRIDGTDDFMWPFQTGSNFSLRVSAKDVANWVMSPHNAIGVAMSWESTYYFHSGTHTTASPTSQNFAKAFSSDLVAWNAEHSVDTEAIMGLGAINTSSYPLLESAITDGYENKIGHGTGSAVETQHMYGLPHYGDYPYTPGSSMMGIGNRGWLHYRIAWSKIPILMFARSGAWDYLKSAIDVNRHIMDLDICHSTATVDLPMDANMGVSWDSGTAYAKYARVNHNSKTWMALQVSTGVEPSSSTGTYWQHVPVKKMPGAPMTTHESGQSHWNSLHGYDCVAGTTCARGTALPSVESTMVMDTQTESLYLYYYISGYKRAKEVADFIATNYVYNADVLASYRNAADSIPERTLSGMLNVPMSKYLDSWNSSDLTILNQNYAVWEDDAYWTPNGLQIYNPLNHWEIMTSAWPLMNLMDYADITGDADCLARLPSYLKAYGSMGLTTISSNTYNYGTPMSVYGYGYWLTSDVEFLKFGRHYHDIWSAWADAPTDGISIGSNAYQWIRFALNAIRFTKDMGSINLANQQYPTFPPMFVKIPQSGDSCTFYINEATDSAFTTTFGFNYQTSITYNTTLVDVGNVTFRVYDPDGVEITGSPFTHDLGFYTVKDPITSLSHRFDNGVDNWLKAISIPQDGKTGSYRITLTVDNGTIALTYLAKNTAGSKAKVPLTAGTFKTYKDTRHYFYVPPGASTVSALAASGNIVLHRPDGTRADIAKQSYTNVSVGGDDDAMWSVSMYSLEALTERTVTVTVDGEPLPDPYIYPNPDNRFELSDNYSGSGATGAENVKVTSNRWPDFETLQTFGDSAAALMGAVTDEEKALAVYRYAQMSSVVTGPVPKSGNFGFTGSNGIIAGDMLLNIYMGQFCTGLAEMLVSIWRDMGYPARLVHPESGHTQAELYWVDTDLVGRWHLFDGSANRIYLYSRDGGHIVSHDDLVMDASLIYRPYSLPKYPNAPKAGVLYSGWENASHERYPSRMDGTIYDRLYDLRQNESVQLYFDNSLNRPKYIPTGNDPADGVTDIEHGPYAKVYGNALWQISPNLTSSDWEDDLTSSSNITTDTGPLVHPTATGTATAVYYFRYPYPITDVEISAGIVRGASDTFKLYVSRDGINWTEKYSAPSGSTNLVNQSLVVDVTGTATGGSSGVLQDTTKTWTINEWVQTSATHPNNQTDSTILSNITTGKSCVALSNTADSVTCYVAQNAVTFTAGDSYRITKYPTSTTQVFGRFDYYMKVEMVAASTPTTVGFSSLTVKNYTQHNIFSLPQLWPVNNYVTVSGDVKAGSKLKITYQWDDDRGSNLQHIAQVVYAPWSYNITADSAKWPSTDAGLTGTGAKCDYIKIECLPIVAGDTNEVLTDPDDTDPPTSTTDVTPVAAWPTYEILGTVINTVSGDGAVPPAVKTAAQYRSDLAAAIAANSFTNTTGVKWTLYGLLSLADTTEDTKTSIEAVFAAQDYQGTVKPLALTAFCQADNYGADCIDWAGKILSRDASITWKDYAVTNELPSQLIWLQASSVAALALSRIATVEAQALSGYISNMLAMDWNAGAYFKIFTGMNDTATLTCPAGDGTITVTPGTYTGAQLATEVQTQMNANATLIDGGSVSYTVIFNPTTRRFTISASAGTIAYSKTNFKSQLMRDLGWNADATAAASITSQTLTMDIAANNAARTALARALGNLKDSVGCSESERAALVALVESIYEDVHAAEALGKCGTLADVPVLETLMADAISGGSDYLKILYPMKAIGLIGDSTDAPQLYNYTQESLAPTYSWDEDFRAVSAEALGKLANQDAVAYITTARAVEPVGWVQSIQDAALALLGEDPEPPPPGPYKNHGSPKAFFRRPLL